MAIVINGSGTITGISVGGLPDGVVDSGTLATNSVDSAELIDGAVDNSHVATGIDAAKLADGTITNSELQYINTLSSNAQTQISAAGGGWEHILTVDASDVANVDFDSAVATYTMADYNHIVLVLKHVYCNTASQILQLQFSGDDGTSYITDIIGGIHTFDVDGLVETDAHTAGETQMDVNYGDAFASGAGVVNYSFSGVFWQPSNQTNATRNQSMRFDGIYGDSGNDTKYIHGFAYPGGSVPSGGIDSFRFKMGSGNITGRFSMYGVKDS